MRITRFKNLFAIAAMATAGFAASRAEAAIIVNDNFDGYANQAAFEAVWTPIGTSGVLSTAQSASAPNSIQAVGTTLNSQNRSQLIFAPLTDLPSSTNTVRFSFDFWDQPSTVAGNPQRNYVNLQAGSTAVSGFLVSMGLNNNLLSTAGGGNYYMARIFGMDGGAGAGNYFKLNDAGAPLRSGGWRNLAVEITDTDFKFFVDGTLAKTLANTATLRSYDRVILGSGLGNGSVPAFYDNVRVETFNPIPEPATLALAGMGLIGLCTVARRKNA